MNALLDTHVWLWLLEAPRKIAYWPPSRDLAIYYRQDGGTIPAPGVIIIGKLDAAADMFNVPGALTVTIERVE